MNYLLIIFGAMGAGIFTAWGLRIYSILCNQADGNLARLLLLPLFVIIFIGGGFVVSNYLNILLGGDDAVSDDLKLGPYAGLIWLSVICLYIARQWRVLKERFHITSPGQSFPASNSPRLNTTEKTNGSHLGYVPELDGLRGFAILSVLATHSLVFFKGGFIGVDIFFVLSGFLISTLLFQEFGRSHTLNLRKFYWRRALRLGPALASVIVVFLVMSWLHYGGNVIRYNLMEVAIVLLYLSNWARAFWFHSMPHFGHTWSLSVEEQFYLLWPVTLLILLRVIRQRSLQIAIMCLLALMAWGIRIYLCRHGADAARIYNGFDTRFDSLMTGCVLAAFWTGGLLAGKIKTWLQRLLFILAPICLLGLIAFMPFMDWSDFRMYHWGFVVVETMTAWLILDILINPQSITRRFFGMKWLMWLGSISYGLYLWHGMVFQLVDGFDYTGLTRFIVGTLLTLLISALCYYGVERPFLALKKW